MKTYTFHVSGMHCASCPVLIKSELEDLPHVAQANASLKHHTLEVHGEFGERPHDDVARELEAVIKKHGYALAMEKQRHAADWGQFSVAIPIALAFMAFFFVLQKLGIVNLVGGDEVTYGTAFVIGLIASVSTCMAVVGGLVLSMSATFAKEGDKVRPQVMFHAGRLVSFFVLGGIVGMLGSAFALNATWTFILSIAVAVILLILGVNLLDIFPSMKRLTPTLPGFLGRHIHGLKNANHSLTPLIAGAATFFLPCGFTQSMQIYTLGTGSFWAGALTMSAFALGTLPVLALLSFSSLAIHEKARSGVFFKTAGLIVIAFGLLNLVNSLVAAGIINPLFSF